MSGKCSMRVFCLRVSIFIDRWLCHNNFCWCCFDLEPFARVVGLVKLPSSNNLQVLQYFWAVVQCSFCNDRWKGKAQQEKKINTVELLHWQQPPWGQKKVTTVERWLLLRGLNESQCMDCLSVCLSFSGGSTEPQVYIARRLPWKCYMYMNELSHEITEFHPQTNQPDKKTTSSDILLS